MDFPNFKKNKKSPSQLAHAETVKKAVLKTFKPSKPRGPKRTKSTY